MLPTPPTPSLLNLARHPDDPVTLAFAGVITRAQHSRRRPLIRGLSEDAFSHLIDAYFPGLDACNGTADTPEALPTFDIDEFDDLVDLLRTHGACGSQEESWLAYAIATASMGENHLWQDMGLPNRALLSALMTTHFPALAARNTGDMKWKKFLYRQLCERAGIPICKSPHCADCCDFRRCFGPEEAV